MRQVVQGGQSGGVALLALGGNQASWAGDSAQTIRLALAWLQGREVEIEAVSNLYQTPAFPEGSGPDYVNAACRVRWTGSPQALMTLCHEAEAAFGRTRQRRWEGRTIDIDLLSLDSWVLPNNEAQTRWRNLPLEQQMRDAPDELILPHPRMQDRSFVLIPLAEVAGDWRHPVTGLDVRAMLDARPEAEKNSVVLLKNA